jgi:hypothetical protein
VGQHVTSPLLEFVAVYISPVQTVDHSNVFSIPGGTNAIQRTRAQVLTQLNANAPITFTVNLPNDIHRQPSPDRRNHVFVRVGVKTVGVTERVYTNVYRIDI